MVAFLFMDARLVKTDRNRVFEILRAVELPVNEFVWSESEFNEGMGERATGSVLTHRPSEYFYGFGHSFDQFSPGEQSRTESQQLDNYGLAKTSTRFNAFGRWAERLKDELDAPDLWAEMVTTQSLAIGTALAAAGVGFSTKEANTFAKELKRIEGRITDLHQLTSAQTEALHDGFEQIKADMNRFGKKDWVSYATGLLFNIMVGAAFAPAAAKDIYNMFVAAVAPLLDVAHKLLQ